MIPINKNKNFLTCPKSNCGRRGFLGSRATKGQVQLPHQNSITNIPKALDYLAKLHYKIFEELCLYPPSKGFQDSLTTNYSSTISFSPHEVEELIGFEKKITLFLEEKFERLNNKIKNEKSTTPNIDSNYNCNTLYRIENEHHKKLLRYVNKAAITHLYCSFSYSVAKDYLLEIREFHEMVKKVTGLNHSPYLEENDEQIARSLVYPFQFLEHIFDKRHHIGFPKIIEVMRYSYEYGSGAASAKYSQFWKNCKRCADQGRVTMKINGMCPHCGNTTKIIARPSSNQFQNIKTRMVTRASEFNEDFNLSENIFRFLENSIKNEGKEKYLELFRKTEEKFVRSYFSYLKTPRYCIYHYNEKTRRKQICSLRDNEIIKSEVHDSSYSLILKLLRSSHLSFNTYFLIHKAKEILEAYHFPSKLMLEKIEHDLLLLKQ